jgi:hypothetical protein
MTVCVIFLLTLITEHNHRMLHDSLCDILVDSYYRTQPENAACQFVWYSCWLLHITQPENVAWQFVLYSCWLLLQNTTRECCMTVRVIFLLTLITEHNQRMLHDSSRECCMTVCVIFLLTRITEHNHRMLHDSLCDIRVCWLLLQNTSIECCMRVCVIFLLTLITEHNQRMLHESLCDILVDSYYRTEPENVAWQFVWYSCWLLLQNTNTNVALEFVYILVDSYYRTQPQNVACKFVWYSCWLLLQNTTRECCMPVCVIFLLTLITEHNQRMLHESLFIFLLTLITKHNQRMLHDSLCDILVDSYYRTQP